MDDINSNVMDNQKISAAMFASKVKTKHEIFRFLTIDCLAYLPKYETITIYFLKDLISGTK